MRSKWYELKPRAIRLRKRGCSIRTIEHRLGISRSTLSGWLKSIPLSGKQKERLLRNWHNALGGARKKAVLWHNAQKEKRVHEAEAAARQSLENINVRNVYTLELALAILYLGEGFKKTSGAGIGNSDPKLLQFFIAVLHKLYHVERHQIKCELHLRADQNPAVLKKYWAKQLRIPLKNFSSPMIDRRTAGTKTYATYKGVCILRCGGVAIQRKLISLSQLFLEKVLVTTAGS